ncbi:hypothetical protein FA13DRAFT_1596660, partial [Coprinellus micaceus]
NLLEGISQSTDVHELSAKINITSFVPGDHKSYAGQILRAVWDCMDYCYRFKNETKGKTYGSTHFLYYCCQNEDMQCKSKKDNNPGVKGCDHEQMEVYDCSSLLNINVLSHSGHISVRVVHRMHHNNYIDVRLSAEVKQFIKDHTHLMTTMIWDEILKTNPMPEFSRKLVYTYWHQLSSQKWKCDDAEVKLANVLLDEASKTCSRNSGSLYAVEKVPIKDEIGYTGIVFVLSEILGKWSGHVKELQIDSMWQTNGSGFKLYTVVSKIYGTTCPLGYLFLQS